MKNTETEDKNEFRPFHDTIVESIFEVTNENRHSLAKLIRNTTIPTNHEKIIAVWKARSQEMGWDENELWVIETVRKQQKIATVKSNGHTST